ncbi:MAG TPA: hypothetical protein VIM79_16750 [Niastella sp.]
MKNKTISQSIDESEHRKRFLLFDPTSRKIWIEIVCFLLMINFFYEGIYKLAHFQQYSIWLTREPLIWSAGKILKFIIPLVEIALSILVTIKSKRLFALRTIIIIEVLLLMWVMSVYLFTRYLFWPYHAFWGKTTWMQNMCFALCLIWATFFTITLIRNKATEGQLL